MNARRGNAQGCGGNDSPTAAPRGAREARRPASLARLAGDAAMEALAVALHVTAAHVRARRRRRGAAPRCESDGARWPRCSAAGGPPRPPTRSRLTARCRPATRVLSSSTPGAIPAITLSASSGIGRRLAGSRLDGGSPAPRAPRVLRMPITPSSGRCAGPPARARRAPSRKPQADQRGRDPDRRAARPRVAARRFC